VSFGAQTLQPVDNGYYLVKLGPDGTQVSGTAVSRDAITTPTSIAFDVDGNAYVAGGLLSTSNGLKGTVFVTKFSPSGSQIFDATFVGSDSQAIAQDIAIEPSGDIVIAGFFNGELSFGTTKLNSLAGASTNGFVAVLRGTDGVSKSAFSFGGTTLDKAETLQVVGTHQLRLAGEVSGKSNIGGATLQAEPAGSSFLAEISDSGTLEWVSLISGSSVILGADTNSAGRTFIAGRMHGAIESTFVAAAERANSLQILSLTKTYEGSGATSCAVDHQGGVWVAGEFQGTVDFGTGPLSGTDPTMPTNFLVHFTP
jgi:hypothetical protein